MAAPVLVIGNKNYSSWSLRPWLALKVLGVAFEELRIPLESATTREAILQHSPSGKVPCLVDGELRVWDSLAIIECVAERYPRLWPADAAARAVARSISAEMHAGFPALRRHMCLNVRKRYPGKGRTPEVLQEVARIVDIWSECRARFGAGGPYLFGGFCAADAMYAPVVLRFLTYAVELAPECRAYSDAMLALPAMQEWIAAAQAEPEVVARFEPYG